MSKVKINAPPDVPVHGKMAGEHAGHAAAGMDKGHGEEHHGCEGIAAGDTVELHWVFSTCDVEPVAPGKALAACSSAACANPQLRVKAQVFYLTEGHRFGKVGAKTGVPDFDDASPGFGKRGAVEYLGSTTGDKYNMGPTCSPLQVTWLVGRDCRFLDVAELNAWCDANRFGENHAHGVRKLVEGLPLLSEIP